MRPNMAKYKLSMMFKSKKTKKRVMKNKRKKFIPSIQIKLICKMI